MGNHTRQKPLRVHPRFEMSLEVTQHETPVCDARAATAPPSGVWESAPTVRRRSLALSPLVRRHRVHRAWGEQLRPFPSSPQGTSVSARAVWPEGTPHLLSAPAARLKPISLDLASPPHQLLLPTCRQNLSAPPPIPASQQGIYRISTTCQAPC